MEGADGTAAMQVMRALHTPLQEATLGSGCKLRMHTCLGAENPKMKKRTCVTDVFRENTCTHLTDVSVAVTHPDVAQELGIPGDGGSGARELQTGSSLADGQRREEFGRWTAIGR